MARVKPFKAIRPRKELAAEVSTLPYDVFSEREARKAVADNPRSFLRVVRPETMFQENTDLYGDEVYEKARDVLEHDIADNTLIQDESECYYIYRQMMGERIQTGVVGCFSVDDYLDNVIRRHELTRPEKEKDRTKHLLTCSAQTGLVFLAYDRNNDINEIIERAVVKEPIYEFTAKDGVKQVVWKINEPDDLHKMTASFAGVDHLYIADGHHRCASAATAALQRRSEHPDYTGEEEFNYTMAVAFSSDQLLIYPYNRAVTDLNGMSDEEFLSSLERVGFTVNKVSPEFTAIERRNHVFKVRRKNEIAMYLSGEWYRLNAKDEILRNDAVGSLDVSLLQNNVLDKLLGITDPRTSDRVDFIGGIRGFEELEKRCNEDMKAAFALYPTSMEELIRVTDEGKIMPPKSTWFEPKLQSGLFVHKIEE